MDNKLLTIGRNTMSIEYRLRSKCWTAAKRELLSFNTQCKILCEKAYIAQILNTEEKLIPYQNTLYFGEKLYKELFNVLQP